ncbi:MAG: sulfotransferase, partial [Candidatus Aminicenantes bacterium]|nr:sulfotransferase [Candidatus Aminicenantes bacterium]
MKICILGVGRSGTTALYTLLQEIFIDRFGKNTDFIYEPFLWDMQAFNGRYNDVVKNFDSMNSLSVEAMYHHQNLPLFIEDATAFKDNPYLDKIFHKTSENALIKFIRANGRFRLLTEICPEAKYIFITRNPLDVINSVVVRFSLLGSEFHRDDWDRFTREI